MCISAEYSPTVAVSKEGLPPHPHLDMFLQLDFMLSRQLFMLPLELCDQELSLELLLVFESHQLLLQLLLRVVCGRFLFSITVNSQTFNHKT